MLNSISWILPSATPTKIKRLMGIDSGNPQEDISSNAPFIKLVIIGGSLAGKSSLWRRFTDGLWSFDNVPGVTIGADFANRRLEIGGQDIRLQVWDTTPTERCKRFGAIWYKYADVYDITNRESFDDLSNWYRQLDTYAPPTAVRILVGNKLDKAPREVSTSEGLSYAFQMKSLFIETSVKTNTNVTELFRWVAEKILSGPASPYKNVSSDNGVATNLLAPTLPTAHDIRVKFLLLGNCTEAKRCLLRRLSEESRVPGVEHSVDTDVHTIEVAGGMKARLSIMDTVSREASSSSTSTNLQGALAVFLVYDLSDRQSFDALSECYAKLENDNNTSLLHVLVGTNPDKESICQVPSAEAEALSRQKNTLFFDLSEEINNDVSRMFREVVERVILREKEDDETDTGRKAKTSIGTRTSVSTDGRSDGTNDQVPGEGRAEGEIEAFKGVELRPRCMSGSLQDSMEENAPGKLLIEWIKALFRDKGRYRALLSLKDHPAQIFVDLFQELLDSSCVQELAFRKEIIVTLQKLAKKAEVYPSSYQVEEEVSPDQNCFMGSGGFGEIYKCQLKDRAVCVKVIRLTAVSQKAQFMREFMKEAVLWAQLSHPNIVPFQGFFYYSNKPCLLSPWMNNGHINDYLQTNPYFNRYLLVKDMTEGLHLHTWDIVHGDLKGANVMVDDSGRACLTDFGISSVFDSTLPHWTSVSMTASKGGSTRWQAPELFESNDDQDVYNTVMSDVYAWGCTCYEVLTGKLPFHELVREFTVMLRVTRDGIRPSRPSVDDPAWLLWGLQEPFWNLMESCWAEQPTERPSVVELLATPLLAELSDHRPNTTQLETLAQYRTLGRVSVQKTLPTTEALGRLRPGNFSDA